jgi:hypothetical protein
VSVSLLSRLILERTRTVQSHLTKNENMTWFGYLLHPYKRYGSTLKQCSGKKRHSISDNKSHSAINYNSKLLIRDDAEGECED